MNAWLTCTPKDFDGGPSFFSRDSGLLCRGFQLLGIPCKAVMPGSPRADDEADLIRTDYANLESTTWWKAQNVAGVVLYAWGRPEFGRIAKAIREAGVFLALNQDSSGVISPATGWLPWAVLKWHLAGKHGRLRAPAYIAGMVRSFLPKLIGYESGRLRHLRQGHVIGAVSPGAMELYQKYFRVHGDEAMAKRVRLIPHPVSSLCNYRTQDAKQNQIICAGRWDASWQKHPDLLIGILQAFLESKNDWKAYIAGRPTPRMEAWHRGVRPNIQERITLKGEVPHTDLVATMKQSKIVLCPSSYESFHITSAEMLCCGGSVVAVDSPLLTSFRWFVSEKSGSLAKGHGASALLAALKNECLCWESGRRDPQAISKIWSSRLNEASVAAALVTECERAATE